MKDINAFEWENLKESFDGERYSLYPLGNKPSGFQTNPTLIDTDIISGSLTGGEFNKGSYMSLFGYNLGRYQDLGLFFGTRVWMRDPLGDNAWYEVANYRSLRKSRVYDKLQVVRLVVQVGSLGGGMVVGRALDVKVTNNGIDTNILSGQFIVQPGRFFFIDPTIGSDATGRVDNINKPFRYLQYTPTGGSDFQGIWTTSAGGTAPGLTTMGDIALRPGDTLVIRGTGTTVWSDNVGHANKLLRFRLPAHNGSTPNGTIGHGYIHITAHPGGIRENAPEYVHYQDAPGGHGGIHGAGQAYMNTTGQFVGISGLHIECNATTASDGAPINLQSGANSWRIYDNELGPWPASIVARAGGIAGHSYALKAKFNYIHDIDSNISARENHGIYIGDADGDGCSKNWEIAYNWILRIPGGNGIQWNNNASSDTFDNIVVHHNWFETTGKHGINMANSITTADIYCNVVIDSLVNSLRFDVDPGITLVNITHNTFVQTRVSGAYTAMLTQTWVGLVNGIVNIKNNIFAMTADHAALTAFTTLGSGDTAVRMSNNLYFDFAGTITTTPSIDAQAVYGNPYFTDMANGDYSCRVGGAGRDAVRIAEPLAMADDFFGVARIVTDLSVPSGAFNDIGAFQGTET